MSIAEYLKRAKQLCESGEYGMYIRSWSLEWAYVPTRALCTAAAGNDAILIRLEDVFNHVAGDGWSATASDAKTQAMLQFDRAIRLAERTEMTQTEQKAAARKERLEAGKSVEDAVNAVREGKDTLWKAIMYEVLHKEGMSLQIAHEIKLKAGLTQ